MAKDSIDFIAASVAGYYYRGTDFSLHSELPNHRNAHSATTFAGCLKLDQKHSA